MTDKTTLASILKDITTINKLAQEIGTKIAMLKNKETLNEFKQEETLSNPVEETTKTISISERIRSRAKGIETLIDTTSPQQETEIKQPSSEVNNMINDMFI